MFESLAHYTSDGRGFIDVRTSESHGGSYRGVWPMGPLSSMVASHLNKRSYERFVVKDPMQPFEVYFRLFDSFVPNLEEIHDTSRTNNKLLTKHKITRTYAAPGVQEQEVWTGRLRGTLYIPPGNTRFPGVLSISGAHPGAFKHKAAILASHGFVALAVRYFGTDDLPKYDHGLDLGYFEEAAIFLKNHTSVDARNGVGIVSNCVGASASLGIASCAPEGLFGCVVAISGWYVSYNTFTYRDKTWSVPETFTLNAESLPDGTMVITSSHPDAENETWENIEDDLVPFQQRHRTAYMFVYGGKDTIHETIIQKMGKHAREMLEEQHHPRYELLFYPDAGHLIEHAYAPHQNVVWTYRQLQHNGGNQPDHSKAQEDSWPKILNFLRQSLTSTPAKL
uniref:bile acid-CoA:amino acid N-acyltransferase-like n=1 Tax=Styela clava TaxID=7725 RepID=UPI00193A5AE9|nr:bile acid-CoA:amino acid N-acyltransferase-like [Styela clava]